MRKSDRPLLSHSVPAACISLLGVARASAVLAQESAEGVRLEEIVVTAERDEKDLQTTPLSVIQVTGEQMAEKGASNIAELATFLPNVSIGPSTQGGGS